ncbi:unnamed protein product, partial [Allacma fusca]
VWGDPRIWYFLLFEGKNPRNSRACSFKCSKNQKTIRKGKGFGGLEPEILTHSSTGRNPLPTF